MSRPRAIDLALAEEQLLGSDLEPWVKDLLIAELPQQKLERGRYQLEAVRFMERLEDTGCGPSYAVTAAMAHFDLSDRWLWKLREVTERNGPILFSDRRAVSQ